MIGGLYFIYWFQDVVGGSHGFYLFGHHIADAGIKGSQVALAVSQVPNQIIGFIITIPAGWISDRFASERCLISCVASVITTIFPLINAFCPSYTAVICASTDSGAQQCLPHLTALHFPPLLDCWLTG